ncbi:type I-E CRISPR-associated protein Cse2/CasB [Spirillospora sp. NPDC127200]
MNTTSAQTAYVNDLYRLGRHLETGNKHQAAAARRTLARLRRSLVDDRFLPDALELMAAHHPRPGEVEPWLLTAGLYALHPASPRHGGRRLPIGAALHAYSDRVSVQARLRQLLAADWPVLTHRLRQAVQLLAGSGIALDYQVLLKDLAVLHEAPAGGQRVHAVRLRWASDFQRPPRNGGGPDHDHDDEAGDPS